MTPAEFLKALMEKTGDNPNSLSGKSKVTQSTIYRFVEGESSEPRTSTFQKIARVYGVPAEAFVSERVRMDVARQLGLIDGGGGPNEDSQALILPAQDTPPEGYIRLDHLPYQPSMGRGRAQAADHIVQHIDVLESFVRQKVGSVSPDRIKILTGVGTSMMPRIKDQDIVFVDIEHRWIDAPGYYVIDVGGLLLLKKAMILSTGVLILRSENIEEYPDEERHDLRKAAETITVCGKVLAWWTLVQG
ncbi:LexA family transcriptional regulator [Parapusillimonas sp. JC17]|uniref:LexA family transcriptional regulator n=1 Tax=Parapusillimonas sp. JC17 TaxID=3445768 RepID=UPI003F9F2E7E